MKRSKNRGFSYYLSEEIIKDYQKKPLELRKMAIYGKSFSEEIP